MKTNDITNLIRGLSENELAQLVSDGLRWREYEEIEQVKTILDADSYKVSQWLQYPEGAEYAESYMEARGGGDEIKFMGLQYVLQQMKVPSVNAVKRAAKIIKGHFGTDEFFNYKGWFKIAKLGYFPLEIQAIKEGTVVETKNMVMKIRNTLPGFVWLIGWFETQFMRVWYPTNVATISYEIKQIIAKFLDETGTPDSIFYKLHDFGSRGATVREAAGVGGLSHLSNFYGTDTMISLLFGELFYGQVPRGYSIAASEHSTITSWGRDFEIDAFRNMIEKFGGPNRVYACVSDSYDIMAALDKWHQLYPLIKAKGGMLVIRPDSGDPVATPVAVIQRAMELFGYTVNAKGYAVLPDEIRIIQGDGINKESITEILTKLKELKISADNIAFGMGGALLQKHNRDTFQFAIKMSAICINGVWMDVFKDPVGDSNKASKRGRLTLVENENGKAQTVRIEEINGRKVLLETVFYNSKLTNWHDFGEIAGYDDLIAA